jgi:hypothetical protein
VHPWHHGKYDLGTGLVVGGSFFWARILGSPTPSSYPILILPPHHELWNKYENRKPASQRFPINRRPLHFASNNGPNAYPPWPISQWDWFSSPICIQNSEFASTHLTIIFGSPNPSCWLAQKAEIPMFSSRKPRIVGRTLRRTYGVAFDILRGYTWTVAGVAGVAGAAQHGRVGSGTGRWERQYVTINKLVWAINTMWCPQDS